MKLLSAIQKINRSGALLVFPINNKPSPESLWSQFFPRTKMRWEWDENGDSKVADMWQLMKRLSADKRVVYSKWYQGRATFFSRKLFTAMLGEFMQESITTKPKNRYAQYILDTLEESSPLSTKQIKKINGLQGKYNEPTYNKAMKELFQRLLIVGFGEVDDGAFPSLAVGATQIIHEDLWVEAKIMSNDNAKKILNHYLPNTNPFRKYLEKQKLTLNLKQFNALK